MKAQNSLKSGCVASSQVYEKPVLLDHGKIRDLTKGGGSGSSEDQLIWGEFSVFQVRLDNRV